MSKRAEGQRVLLNEPVIKYLMSAKKLKSSKVASMLNMGPAVVSKYIKGMVATPLDIARRIAEIIGADLNSIVMDGEDFIIEEIANMSEQCPKSSLTYTSLYKRRLNELLSSLDEQNQLLLLLEAVKFCEKIRKENCNK